MTIAQKLICSSQCTIYNIYDFISKDTCLDSESEICKFTLMIIGMPRFPLVILRPPELLIAGYTLGENRAPIVTTVKEKGVAQLQDQIKPRKDGAMSARSMPF